MRTPHNNPRAALEKSIYRYILRYSLRQQIVLTLFAIASYPFLYAFYELPKTIVNQAIQGKNISFPVTVLGFEFDQVSFLFLLCGLFLLIVAFNQAFKYLINVYKGLTGERMLRRLRYDLYARILRFPLPHFRKVSQGELIPMITAEVESIGGFIGDAFALPIYQGGILLVTLTFLFVQNPIMAAAAIVMYPVQFYVIPKLQRKVRGFGRERVRLVRRLSDRVGETVGGVHEVHGHNTARAELAEFTARLGAIFDVRMNIYIWKFVVKFINNASNQVGPFFFYAIGGYLVIQGELSIGVLVAALAAHKELASPWKELLDFYQQSQDAEVKYEQIIEQFELPGLVDEAVLLAEPEQPPSLLAPVTAQNVVLQDDTGAKSLDGVSFALEPGEHVAVVGAGASGKDDLALVLARLLRPTGGTITVGPHRLPDLPEAVTGRNIAYVGPHAYVFNSTVRENLLYGLKHRPIKPKTYQGEEAERAKRAINEAIASGNSTDDPYADWLDYRAAGVDEPGQLVRRAFEVLRLVDLDSDIYELGLRGVIDPAARADLAGKVLEARAAFRTRAADSEIAELVETFDPGRFNDNASIAENLLFGLPVGNRFDIERMGEHPYVAHVLEKARLTQSFVEVGREVAATMVELFAGLPPGHEFFERYSFINSEDLPVFQAMLTRIERAGLGDLGAEDRQKLMSLPFKLIPARHRFDVLNDEFKARVLEARRIFAAELPDDLKNAVEFFDPSRYIAAASLQDNVLFGKIAYGHSHGAERISALIGEVIDQMKLRQPVMEVGLDFPVGIAGARLSAGQRQKLAIGRATLKRPEIMVLNQATAALDAASESRVMQNLLKESKGRSLIWVLQRTGLARNFDRVLVLRNGRVAAQGKFGELDTANGPLQELLKAE